MYYYIVFFINIYFSSTKLLKFAKKFENTFSKTIKNPPKNNNPNKFTLN